MRRFHTISRISCSPAPRSAAMTSSGGIEREPSAKDATASTRLARMRATRNGVPPLPRVITGVTAGPSVVEPVWIIGPPFVVADNYSFSSNLSIAHGMVTGFGMLMALPVSVSR